MSWLTGIQNLDGICAGDLYTTTGSDVYRVQYMCELPTITLVNLDTGETICGAVGCERLRQFVRLRKVGEEEK